MDRPTPNVLPFPTPRSRYGATVDDCIESLHPVIVALGRKYGAFVIFAALITLVGGMLREVRIRYGLKIAVGAFQRMGRMMNLE
jgi:hypothetical protein